MTTEGRNPSLDYHLASLRRLISEREREPQLPILFHGTTVGRFQSLLTADGGYKPRHADERLWLDEQLGVPLAWARGYQKQHNSDALLLFIRTDMTPLRERQGVPGFWTINELPPGSFLPYNVTQDPHGLFENPLPDNMEDAQRVCTALRRLPEYAALFI